MATMKCNMWFVREEKQHGVKSTKSKHFLTSSNALLWRGRTRRVDVLATKRAPSGGLPGNADPWFVTELRNQSCCSSIVHRSPSARSLKDMLRSSDGQHESCNPLLEVIRESERRKVAGIYTPVKGGAYHQGIGVLGFGGPCPMRSQ